MKFFALFLFSLVAVGCGAPTPDPNSANGKAQILDEVNIDLTSGDCDDALTAITPLYNSSNTDNDVRLAMASVYGCKAGINFFGLVGTMTSNVSSLESGFFAFLKSNFPSTAGQDYVVEGALLAIPPLQAALNTGALVLSADQINAGTYNVGSDLYTDRTDESNFYLIFISMAAVGGIESRFDTPGALTWTTAAAVDADGCKYAASILNLIDALTASKSYLPSAVGTAVDDVLNGDNVPHVYGLAEDINAACSYGCSGQTPTLGSDDQLNLETSGSGWVGSGCSSATVDPCSTCPDALRDWTQCGTGNTNQATCAAAGIINFINHGELGWQ